MGSVSYACILRAFVWRFALRHAARAEFRKFPGSPDTGSGGETNCLYMFRWLALRFAVAASQQIATLA